MNADDFIAGELLSVSGGRTGVIVGCNVELTSARAAEVRELLEARFPGVTFAVVSGCSSLVSFTFDAEDDQ